MKTVTIAPSEDGPLYIYEGTGADMKLVLVASEAKDAMTVALALVTGKLRVPAPGLFDGDFREGDGASLHSPDKDEKPGGRGKEART